MQDIRVQLEWGKRKMENFIVRLAAKRQVALDEFDFITAGKLENAMLALQKALHEMFFAQISLGL